MGSARVIYIPENVVCGHSVCFYCNYCVLHPGFLWNTHYFIQGSVFCVNSWPSSVSMPFTYFCCNHLKWYVWHMTNWLHRVITSKKKKNLTGLLQQECTEKALLISYSCYVSMWSQIANLPFDYSLLYLPWYSWRLTSSIMSKLLAQNEFSLHVLPTTELYSSDLAVDYVR